MASFHELPNKEQIAAIDDIKALGDIRDEVDRAIARIETDLEYSDRDDDWYARAKNALALHKYVGTMIDRRLRELQPRKKASAPFAPLASVSTNARRRTDWNPLTDAALRGDIPDPETVSDDLPALEEAAARVLEQINAMKDDKEDETLNYNQDAWDQEWLSRLAAAQRRCGIVHQALLRRLSAAKRKHKAAVQARRDATRPQAFVDAAREVLDRETFLAIWEVVDRREPLTDQAA